MKAEIFPSLAEGIVKIPPSKSMSHRAIICASLAKGTSVIKNVAYSKDIKVTIEGMKQLGADIQTLEDSLIIKGIDTFKEVSDEVYCHESGSTLRFFIPIFSLTNAPVKLTGVKRLLQRPQTVYKTLFEQQGLSFIQDETSIQIKESLKPGNYTIQGDVSSQFISGLLFTLPLLKEDSTIHIQPPFESRSYVDLTIQMLKTYGVQASFLDDLTIQIKGNQSYKACDYTIEGDYSQLAFYGVLGAINNDIEIKGISHTSLQGDKEIIPILKSMGCQIENTEYGYKVMKSNLNATNIDLNNCPDLGPILCVLASCAKGTTHIYNAGRLRLKESDRIAAMEEELKKFNVNITSTEDEIFIEGTTNFITNKTLHGHNDHRIVMALSILASISNQSCVIDDAQAITKSYPDFFKDLASLGIGVKLYD